MIPGLCSLFYPKLGGSSGSFSVVATPPALDFHTNFAPGYFTSDISTAMPTGGIPPYTYQWIYMSGDLIISIDSPTSDNTTFTSYLNPGDYILGFYRCLVTDGASNVGSSNDVSVLFTASS